MHFFKCCNASFLHWPNICSNTPVFSERNTVVIGVTVRCELLRLLHFPPSHIFTLSLKCSSVIYKIFTKEGDVVEEEFQMFTYLPLSAGPNHAYLNQIQSWGLKVECASGRIEVLLVTLAVSGFHSSLFIYIQCLNPAFWAGDRVLDSPG